MTDKIETLRTKLGAAVLDMGKGPATLHDAIASARREEDESSAAETERVRRQRLKDAEDAEHTRYELREELERMETARLDAINHAEGGARLLTDGLRQAMAVAREMRRNMAQLGGTMPISFDESETEARLSRLLSSLLGTVSKPQKFGRIEWASILFDKPSDDWREREQREGARALEPFLNNTKEKSHDH